jgi:hypothetical protein
LRVAAICRAASSGSTSTLVSTFTTNGFSVPFWVDDAIATLDVLYSPVDLVFVRTIVGRVPGVGAAEAVGAAGVGFALLAFAVGEGVGEAGGVKGAPETDGLGDAGAGVAVAPGRAPKYRFSTIALTTATTATAARASQTGVRLFVAPSVTSLTITARSDTTGQTGRTRPVVG